MSGHPYAVRLAFGPRRPKHPVPGRDVAGVAAEVGSQVTNVAVGDEVIGTADGSLAELAVVPKTRIASKAGHALLAREPSPGAARSQYFR